MDSGDYGQEYHLTQCARLFGAIYPGQWIAVHQSWEVRMSIAVIIVIVIVVVAVAVAAVFYLRRRAVQRQFGPEYDRLAQEKGPRQAREELTERKRMVEELDLKPLSPQQLEEYERRWDTVQEQFVGSPAASARAAAQLVAAAARDIGYSADDEDKLEAELSARHASAMEGYRHAKEMTGQASEATTESLRQSLLDYRVLFRELVTPEGEGTGETSTREASTGEADDTPGSRRDMADTTKE